MAYYCDLQEEFNSCPHFHEDKRCTAIDTKCSFRRGTKEKEVIKNPYVRKERWYEKYYK